MPNARVLIDGPSELVFDYAIPAGFPVQPGCRVRVPLRKKSATGTVLSLAESPQEDFALRELESLVDPEPLITPVLLKTGRWIADYYGSSLESVVRSLLPEAVRTEENSAKTRRIAVLDAPPAEDVLAKLEKRAARQHALLSLLMHAPDRRLAVADLGEGSNAALKALEKAGLLRIETEEVRRDPEADGVEEILESKPLVLTPQQAKALEVINESIATPGKPILLLGVTGSGKTEVYLQAAQHALDLGKTVLVLVPEISLTPQTVQRFKARFAGMQDKVAVLHSNLSQGERFDEWHRIRKGVARIVIGARSAVFAPLPDLGLILVDEEHENSYKQENPPRYHGRDVAVLRAAFEPCAVVLGSATPSLESWQNTRSGKYHLVRLDQRADGQSMPLVRVVDMKLEAMKQKGPHPILSDRLRTALERRLEKGEQSILFLNRRGFARSLQCPKCGHVCQCPHCAVALTYHRTDDRLVCHVCGHQAVVPRKCPECHDPSIVLQGYGTQKVEDVLQRLLPKAKFARIDADAMRRKHALRDTLNAFKAHKIDILIGTQMIAKGLHFPNVTLVGILNADVGLHVPDFRAGERTFQLLTQVAGRAGRGELEGEVIVQTFTPHSPSIQYARQHDFDGFSDQELEFRQQFSFPPFAHCAVLTARSTHERRAEFTLQTLHRRLLENAPPHLNIGEPLPSPLVKSHGQFRFQITLRGPAARPLSRHVQQVLEKTSLPDDVTVVFDMDAQNFS
ncbi:primosomal protein N' [Luteolibacter ambystomatis]|uniref:Replication restart protein PriA n=1 Tax=Luteolibacter ambystomatis TaxID=2824561 RepID=A0A975G8J5_9BACT|nr:primosomal protein N' [Luteolibacter ambystomatis]QUE50943.1 primosomal protein N' [Luteolibacter ambystomatis]